MAFSSTTTWIFSLKKSLINRNNYFFTIIFHLICLKTNFFPNQLRGPSPLSPMWIDPGFPTSNSLINVTISLAGDQRKDKIKCNQRDFNWKENYYSAIKTHIHEPVRSDWEFNFCSSFIWRTVLDSPAAISPLGNYF